MERQKGIVMKKGPWTAEEDEILINYVNKFGPRDWSSLRSKGLLPRTGKSCRLRWVNRLQPNLKTGCKFTADEERVVIELQAQFGNKWAKIATYLEGRTDNDVKNFWSTRRKRLERILQTPQQKSQKNKQRSLESQRLHEMPVLEVPSSSSSQPDEQSSTWKDHFKNAFQLENSEMHKMATLSVQSSMLTMENENEIFGTSTIHMVAPFDPFSHCRISQFAQSSQEIGMFPDCHELVPNHIPCNVQDVFEPGETLETNNSLQFMSNSMPTEQEIKAESSLEVKNENPYYATPDDCFDDITADLFDFFDRSPPSLN
ncbi:myb-related protein 306-like protein [Cucumis melo var. makuwa]|uniref:Myb-related protein 306-like protein n=1 Tax=Cucumis melo var. makuwa TaxID=1194695 RepID=A0A5D3CYV7_CUCMM|nr:myb-related protein 306-like protein [Cucumis melo var. makuwa]